MSPARVIALSVLVPLLASSCSDYLLRTGHDRDTEADTDTDSDTDTDTDSDTDAPDPVDCTGVVFDAWSWQAGSPFVYYDDPVDDAGHAWYEPSFEAEGFVPVSLPDQTIPIRHDRVYRSTFQLSSTPPNISLDFASDDGIRVYVNGIEVGSWGGDWQDVGCVNADPLCIHVDPVDVTPFVGPGSNLVAARVSNPEDRSWFELEPVCVGTIW